MKDIGEYTIAIIANHNVYDFLQQLVISLIEKKIRFKKVVIGNAGLFPGEVDWVENQLGPKVEFISFETQLVHNDIRTQDKDYRKIIDNRIPFLREIFNNNDTERVLQLDVDTSIISNDFSLLEKGKDVTLTVREVDWKDHVLGKSEKDYPNCGVIFWNNPKNCLKFLLAWEDAKKMTPASSGQYEQNYFYHAMMSKAFSNLDVQRLHCRYYNCYEARWINNKTSIVHYKGKNSDDTYRTRTKRLNRILKKTLLNSIYKQIKTGFS